MTKDHGLPTVRGIDGATVTLAQRRARDDRVARLVHDLRSAIAFELLPSHTDPTINLHDVFYAIEGDRVLDVWPIAARGYAEHRLWQ